MKLQVNTKYSQAKLIEWFGVSSATFYRNKEKYLKELRKYCNYNQVSNTKIFITEVFEEEYVPPEKGLNNQDKIKQVIPTFWGEGNNQYGIDTRTNVAEKIEVKKEQYHISTKLSTNRKYVGQALKELLSEDESLINTGGIVCKIALDAEGNVHYLDFTPEEKEKKKKIYNDVFSGKDWQQLNEQEMANYELRKAGEIDEDEYRQIDDIIKTKKHTQYWVRYKNLLSKEFNCVIATATKIEKGVKF